MVFPRGTQPPDFTGPTPVWSGLEPGQRARHAGPQLAGAGGVVDRFALLTEHRVGGRSARSEPCRASGAA